MERRWLAISQRAADPTLPLSYPAPASCVRSARERSLKIPPLFAVSAGACLEVRAGTSVRSAGSVRAVHQAVASARIVNTRANQSAILVSYILRDCGATHGFLPPTAIRAFGDRAVPQSQLPPVRLGR